MRRDQLFIERVNFWRERENTPELILTVNPDHENSRSVRRTIEFRYHLQLSSEDVDSTDGTFSHKKKKRVEVETRQRGREAKCDTFIPSLMRYRQHCDHLYVSELPIEDKSVEIHSY